MAPSAKATKRAAARGEGNDLARMTELLIEGSERVDVLEAAKRVERDDRPTPPVSLKMPSGYGRRGRGLTPLQELAQFQASALREGEEFLRTHPWFMPTLKRLEEECPHVPREELVGLCRLRDQDLIVAAAHRKEYNATHRPPSR